MRSQSNEPLTLPPEVNDDRARLSNNKPSTSAFVKFLFSPYCCAWRPPRGESQLAAPYAFMGGLGACPAESMKQLPNPQRIRRPAWASGVESLAERHRDRRFSCELAAAERSLALSGRYLHPRGPPLLLDTLGMGFPDPQRRRLREHPRDGSLPRTRQSRRMWAESSSGPTIAFIPVTGATSPRRYAPGCRDERNSRAWRVVLLRRFSGSRRLPGNFLASDDCISHAPPGQRPVLPVADYSTLLMWGTAQGSRRPDRTLQSAPRVGFDLPKCSIFEASAAVVLRQLTFTPGKLL